MPETDSSVAVTQKIVDILDAAKVALGLQEVYYGDQDLIPSYPSVVCQSFNKAREIPATGQWQVELRTGIVVYHGKIAQSTELNTKQTEQLAEAVEAKLHEDRKLDGLVIYGFVESIEYGRAVKASEILQATLMVWAGISRTART